MEKFLKRWGVKKDNLYYFIVFNTFKRNNGETIPEFNNRFCKLYHCIPGEVNPRITFYGVILQGNRKDEPMGVAQA